MTNLSAATLLALGYALGPNGTAEALEVDGHLGLPAGARLAAGVHQQVAATDTVVTGLSTVTAVVVSFRDAPTINQLFVTGTIGDQAGSPAAGSINISTFKPTATGNVTPVPATVFTDNINFDWVAIGT
jgi:hypothetical protein